MRTIYFDKDIPKMLAGRERYYLGHEALSELTEVGAKVTRFRIGDRALMYSYVLFRMTTAVIGRQWLSHSASACA